MHKRHLEPLLDRAIAYAYNEGCRDFYLGGAVGFDTVAARQVLAFKLSYPDVRLHLVLPCRDQTDNWSFMAADMYDYLLSQADSVEYTSERYTKGCMLKRNKRLAELGDIVIAYLGHGRSGASQTVRLAEELGRRIYNLYPTLDKYAGR